MLVHPIPDLQCDVCARMTNRLHGGDAYGMECWACDECCGYDAAAYDEAAAIYAEEEDDPQEIAYEERRRWYEQHDRSEP